MVRAKFKVQSVKVYEGNRGEVEMWPVSCGSDENKTFWKYTPAGSLKMTIDNPDAMGQFIPGDEFYVDFTKAG